MLSSLCVAPVRSCELLVSTFSHQYHLLSSGLRFFTVYGPWGRVDMFPFILLDSIVRGKTVKQFGDGSSSRDFTYISDIVDGIIAVHDGRRMEGESSRQHEVFNLGNSHPIGLSDYIRLTEAIVGKKAKVEVVEAQMGDVQHTFADCSKAQRMVGYQPRVSIEEGMKRTYRWSSLTSHPTRIDSWLARLQLIVPPSPCPCPFGCFCRYVDEYVPWRKSHPPPLKEERDAASSLAAGKASSAPAGALSDVLMCTRVHCGNVADAAAFLNSTSFRSNLRAWLRHAVSVAAHVAIAVDCTDGRVDVVDSVEEALQSIDGARRVQLVKVSPWSRFVPALNALLQRAAAIDEVHYIYFTSLEAQSSLDEVQAMHSELSTSSSAMVVGLRLPGHEWHGPDHLKSSAPSSSALTPLSGLTCPWNTNALWSVRLLSRTGFLAISDDAVHGGVEEVAVVATHAALHASGEEAGERKEAAVASASPPPLAVLIDFDAANGVRASNWKAEWEDAGRRAWHEKKMASKAERAMWQLQQIELEAASSRVGVLHKTLTVR